MYIQGRWNKGAQGAQVPPPQVLAEIEAKTLPCHPIFKLAVRHWTSRASKNPAKFCNKFLRRIFRLLTIASFKSGVPSILFYILTLFALKTLLWRQKSL